MPITANNRPFNTIAEDGTEELAFIEIDYGNDVSSETGDFDDATVTTGGLGMIQRGLEQFVNVLGKGPLTDSNTRQTFIVRADGLSRDSDENGGLEYNTIEASIQTALRAIDTNFRGKTPGLTANLSGLTVAVKALDLQTAAADDSTANPA